MYDLFFSNFSKPIIFESIFVVTFNVHIINLHYVDATISKFFLLFGKNGNQKIIKQKLKGILVITVKIENIKDLKKTTILFILNNINKS